MARKQSFLPILLHIPQRYFLIWTAVLSCASSGAAPSNGGPLLSSDTFECFSGQLLEGEIFCDHFVVPEGAIVWVSDDLSVNAAESIDILGTLEGVAKTFTHVVEDGSWSWSHWPISGSELDPLHDSQVTELLDALRAVKVNLHCEGPVLITGFVQGGTPADLPWDGEHSFDIHQFDGIQGLCGGSVTVGSPDLISIGGQLIGGKGGRAGIGGVGGRGGDVVVLGDTIDLKGDPNQPEGIGGDGGVAGNYRLGTMNLDGTWNEALNGGRGGDGGDALGFAWPQLP